MAYAPQGLKPLPLRRPMPELKLRPSEVKRCECEERPPREKIQDRRRDGSYARMSFASQGPGGEMTSRRGISILVLVVCVILAIYIGVRHRAAKRVIWPET